MTRSVIFAGVSGAIMVAMGAWASHGFGGGETARGWIATGAQYGLWHGIALVAVAGVADRTRASRLLTASAVLFAAGIVLFSGSLFIRALTALDWISPATPLGGLCFIGGWLILAAWGAARYLRDDGK
ncbi:MAG: DUF423 domain-containing protein [Rhodospirillales bacterium]|nr:MAG: DUF423 domain-containing protein [Rhodospirillales bacterium]